MTFPKTQQMSLRISPECRQLLEAAASHEHRTIANMIEYLVIDFCKRNRIETQVLSAGSFKTQEAPRAPRGRKPRPQTGQ